MLKTEALILNKEAFIKRRLVEEGFALIGEWHVRLTVADVFRMYKTPIPRIATLLRMPFLVKTKVIWVRRSDAVKRMHVTKQRLRQEIWGRRFDKGGFIHAPDSDSELIEHAGILSSRVRYSVFGDNGRVAASSFRTTRDSVGIQAVHFSP